MNIGISDSFTIKTPLSIEEIQSRLAEVVEPNKTVLFPYFSAQNRKAYQGRFDANGFEIERIITYRNSFLPTITGTITEVDYASRVEVNINLNPFAYLFLFFWVGILSMGFLCATLNALNDHSFSLFNFSPIVLLVFGVAMTIFGFQIEAPKSKAFLYDLFEAEQPATDKK